MEPLRAVVLLLLFLLPVTICGWSVDGHFTTCKIAQARLNEAAADAVNDLLPMDANGDLASLCSWADQVTSPLHYIETPDKQCTYEYNRDCKDKDGVQGRCLSGAINNYTTQLLDYHKKESMYNYTEALLYLSHFMGDIHQPLHVGFASDKGGKTIDVQWFTRKTVLHEVWDENMIQTAKEKFYNSSVETYIGDIQTNITKGWEELVKNWESCSRSQINCPDIYATEGIKAACDWAYNGVENNSALGDDYFQSRLPILNQQLAQGGVRLAATLNQILG